MFGTSEKIFRNLSLL